MEPIRIGMIGVGHFGKYRRDTLRRSGLFQMVQVCARRPEALAEAMKEEECEGTTSFQEMLDRKDIEAIVVSTGPDSHMEYGVQAMKAGKHVFLEKPLCCDLEEMRAIINTGEQTGRVMGMGHGSDDSPFDNLVRKYIADDRFGTVTAIELGTSHGGGWLDSSWRFVPEKNPGGMLFQCGVHKIHWLESMFGRVVEVSSMMRYDVNPNTRTSDASTVLLRLESGLLATLTAYHVTAYHHFNFIYGTKGNMYEYGYPTELYFQERANGAIEPKVAIQMPSEGWEESELTNVRTWGLAIRGEGTPDPSVYHGARALAVVIGAEISARTHSFVTIPDIKELLAGGSYGVQSAVAAK